MFAIYNASNVCFQYSSSILNVKELKVKKKYDFFIGKERPWQIPGPVLFKNLAKVAIFRRFAYTFLGQKFNFGWLKRTP